MRVPVSSTPHASPNSNHNNNQALWYEPTSVLDPCRSPNSGTGQEKPTDHSTAISNSQESSVELDGHVLHNLDWDSIMKDLGLQDDSTAPVLKTMLHPNPCDLPEFPPQFQNTTEFTTLSDICSNQNMGYNFTTTTNTNIMDHLVRESYTQNNNNDFDFIEELVHAADCFDNNQLHVAQLILERLNQRLRSPVGKPLHRAAFYFKEALQSLLSGSNRTPRISSLVEIVQRIKTFKAFSGISLIPMFSIFTTNQALLEALHPSSFMHVIDFEIGLGIQYASLMMELADKLDSSKLNSPPMLRITAVVPEEYTVESQLIRENLIRFGNELRIRVQVDFVLLRTFETLSFKAVKFVDGERTAMLLSPAIFRHVGSNNTAAFLSNVRRVSPSVVLFVDGEGWTDAAVATSFRRSVVSSLEFYSMMLESLDGSVAGGGVGDWVRRIEMLLLRPKIVAAVEGAGMRVPRWRETFYGAGMRPVLLSQFTYFQAECLLARLQIRGFHVSKRYTEVVLYWNERAMVAMSAWRC